MAKYPRIEQVFVKDLEPGDVLIYIELPADHRQSRLFDRDANQVLYTAIISVTQVNPNTTAIEWANAGSEDGIGSPTTVNLNSLDVVLIAIGNIDKLVN